jgi:hypothetical protein
VHAERIPHSDVESELQEEPPAEALLREDVVIEEDPLAGFADELMDDEWAELPDAGMPDPEVDWRSADNADWDA